MLRTTLRIGRWMLSASPVLYVLLTSCGGGSAQTPSSTQTPNSPTTFTVGGMVSGLTGSGLVLQNNGSDNLSIAASGSFAFQATLASQATYAVTVSAQPVGQVCGVQNGTGAVASSNITNVTVSCFTSRAGGTGTLGATGGTVTTAAATVASPPGASLVQQSVTITSIAPPSGLPKGLTPAAAAVDIAISNVTGINAPFLITLPYDPTGMPDENQTAVVHYNTTTSRYEPLTILKHDTTAHAFLVETRTFSPFVIVNFVATALDVSHSASGFSPANNGWNIPNFGSYFSPGGNCLGMSAYAVWYFDNNVSPALSSAYSATHPVPSIAQLVVIRAHLAQSGYWAVKSSTYLNQLPAATTAELMKMYIDVFDQPLILLLGTNGGAQHASVLYGYTATSFQFYDVNVVGTPQNLTFDGTNFGTYTGFNTFAYVALPSVGRTEEFSSLTTEAQGGFSSSSLISVTSPIPGQQIAAHSATLSGTLSSSINPAASMIAYVKGIPQSVATSPGAFSATIPIANGDNSVVLLAGVNIAQQSNWYPNAATLVLDVTGSLPATKLLTTLTWNQDNTDVDLYVTEPSPSNQTAWFANLQTSNRLTLDFDNTGGFGPEHTTLTTTGTNPGIVLPGLYTIKVHYYSDHGSGQTVTGSVSIVLNEGTTTQLFQTQPFTIFVSNSENASPGATGSDWVTIGTVNVAGNAITVSAVNARPVEELSPQEATPPEKYKLAKP